LLPTLKELTRAILGRSDLPSTDQSRDQPMIRPEYIDATMPVSAGSTTLPARSFCPQSFLVHGGVFADGSQNNVKPFGCGLTIRHLPRRGDLPICSSNAGFHPCRPDTSKVVERALSKERQDR
jgi:hypothetical protein